MSATDTMNALKEAAITARAETLKEVIEILEKQSKYNIESGFPNDAEVCDWILENKIRPLYDEIRNADFSRHSAITARAETLKEVIYFCEQEIYAYERLFSALGNPDELRGKVATAKKD